MKEAEGDLGIGTMREVFHLRGETPVTIQMIKR